MTDSSTTVSGSPDAPGAGAFSSRATQPFYWSVRRELWENRSIYIAPVTVAAVVLFGFLVSMVGLPRAVRAASALDGAHHAARLALPYHFGAAAIVLTSLVVAVFYCLGALHGERRDRSILFWKSLPVSDLTTVLSKAIIPLAVLPLVVFAVVVAVQLVMLSLSTTVLLMSGISPALLWAKAPLLSMSLVLLYGLVTLTLWFAPVWGWLLLVSAWARGMTFVWAVAPPLALCLFEKIAFNTSHLWGLLGYRLGGGFTEAFRAGATEASGLAQVDPVKFLSAPGLWTGLAVAAGFLATAAWLRRNREPI